MPPKRKSKKDEGPKKRQTKQEQRAKKEQDVELDDLYGRIVVHKEKAVDEAGGLLVRTVWPALKNDAAKYWELAAHLLSQEYADGPANRVVMNVLLDDSSLWKTWCQHVFESPTTLSVHCFDLCWNYQQDLLFNQVENLHLWMPARYREWYLRLHCEAVVEGDNTEEPFVVTVIQKALHLMEGDLLKLRAEPATVPVRIDDADQESDDLDDEANADGIGGYYEDEGVIGTDNPEGQPQVQQPMVEKELIDTTAVDHEETVEAWKLLHRALELICDLLSCASVRDSLIAYLQSIHWTVRCRFSIGTSKYSTADANLLLAQQLLDRMCTWMHGFPVEKNKPLSVVERRDMYLDRAKIFQKMCHRHYSEHLPDIVFAGVGLLCTAPDNGSSFLRQALDGLKDDEFMELMHKMRLVDAANQPFTRSFLLAVLEDYVVIPQDPLEELQAFPLFPTEIILWDFSRIPPSHSNLLQSPVLSLPKLQPQFLSFADYLWRNFELMRLESAYEIRSDLTDVIRRIRPVLRETMSEDHSQTVIRTELTGWARMALEMEGKLDIIRVNPPRLGERYPSQVLAEVTIDLAPYGDSIRREWDEMGEYDNLILVAIDARKMSGQPPPANAKGRVPDEDDPTFPKRFGVTLVRGCMVLQVRDEAGTVLSDPAVEEAPSGSKRIFRVALDSTQYADDKQTAEGSDMYNRLNLVVRRHGKADNFRSVLETIRGLMAGMGSINRVIPSWLQPVLLGQGEADKASYQSDTVKAYARATAGVPNPDAYLDYGDTFLDEEHLRFSFFEFAKEIIVDGRSKPDYTSVEASPRCNYRVRTLEDEDKIVTVEALSYPFPDGVGGNPVRFRPLQVAAIRSGLSPGLSLMVGPPGTGKTDVAVQIIASLYHSFPTQRTIVITHSNAALNDIFQKVMARGDVEERYMVRLGAGERELQIDSTHDFTKQGRVAYSFARRATLLEEVQQVSESLGISGRAERGADGSPAYTCETAAYFYQHQVQKRIKAFESEAIKADWSSDHDVKSSFPFTTYFKAEDEALSYAQAQAHFSRLSELFSELAEYRPLELLRSHRQRSDYLIMKQARVVAMTCTHAAIARSNLIKLGFEYDNVVVEEAGQMLEIECFIPLLLQRGQADDAAASRLKRVVLMGDHNQLPPVIQNMAIAKYSSLDQSLFARLVRLGVPYIQLDRQGRARPEIAKLYSWRYDNLGNLDHVVNSAPYTLANPGLSHTFQLINVEDFEGKGETSPTAYFYQNVGEAEYCVALFMFMVLIGYSPKTISILTTYNGQKALIHDILNQRCGVGTPLEGVRPGAVSTVDQYQGQQNDVVLLSLVRTLHVGHIRDIRRLVVAVSRARFGLYVFGRQGLFAESHELQPVMEQFAERPNKLELVLGENYPTEREVGDEVSSEQLYKVDDAAHMASMVHQMQESWINDE